MSFEDLKTLDGLKIIGDEMIWKGAALEQLGRFKKLGADLGVDPLVVSTHTSKSIALPVVFFGMDDLKFVMCHNFYDMNLWVRSANPINLPLSDLFAELDMKWYGDEIERKRGYCYRDWSDEEMDDPRILRVKVKSEGGREYDSEVDAGEKDRWIKRWESTEWYGKDWSGGVLIAVRSGDGRFPKDTKFYHSGSCFAEGMDNLWDEKPPHYEPGCTNFIMCTGWDKAEQVVKLLCDV